MLNFGSELEPTASASMAKSSHGTGMKHRYMRDSYCCFHPRHKNKVHAVCQQDVWTRHGLMAYTSIYLLDSRGRTLIVPTLLTGIPLSRPNTISTCYVFVGMHGEWVFQSKCLHLDSVPKCHLPSFCAPESTLSCHPPPLPSNGLLAWRCSLHPRL